MLSKRAVSAALSAALVLGSAMPAYAGEEEQKAAQPEADNLLLSPEIKAMGIAATPVEQLKLQGFTATEDDETGNPRFIAGSLSSVLSTDQAVGKYLAVNQGVFGLSDASNELNLIRKSVDGSGQSHYLYQQMHGGIPVYGKYLQLHLDASKRAYAVQNRLQGAVTKLSTGLKASLSAEEAVAKLQENVEQQLGKSIELGGELAEQIELPQPEAKLVIYPRDGVNHLAYEVHLSYMIPSPGNWVGFVDAHTGKLIHKYDNLQHGAAVSTEEIGFRGDKKTLNVHQGNILRPNEADSNYYMQDITKPMYNAETKAGMIATTYFQGYKEENGKKYYDWEFVNKNNLPFNSAAKSSTSHAVDAHYNVGKVYDFYLNKFNRNSYNGKGSSLQSIVHMTKDQLGNPDIDNAYWNGAAMLFGDGVSYECFACAGDVVAHEITHGVTQTSAGLIYENQPGALNEAFSDIMAAVFDSNDWTIGEDTGSVIRDLSDPEKYNQPKHMKDFKAYPETDYSDNGGVHYNSGIPNHAAYLIAENVDALEIPGVNGREVLGELAYTTLTKYLSPVSEFEDARDGFLLAVTDWDKAHPGVSDGDVQRVYKTVLDAWSAVGLGYTDTEQKYHSANVTYFSIPSIRGDKEKPSNPLENDTQIDFLNSTVVYNVPTGTNINNLTPEILISTGAKISPAANAPQDFSKPVEYKVTAQDGTTWAWTVVVVKASENDGQAPVFKQLSVSTSSQMMNRVVAVEFNERVLDFKHSSDPEGLDFNAGKLLKDKIRVGDEEASLGAEDTAVVKDGKLYIQFKTPLTKATKITLLPGTLIDLNLNFNKTPITFNVPAAPQLKLDETGYSAVGLPNEKIALVSSEFDVPALILEANAKGAIYFGKLPKGKYYAVQFVGDTTGLASEVLGNSDLEAPSVPTNFRAEQVGPSSTKLRWDAATDNTGVVAYALSARNLNGDHAPGSPFTVMGTTYEMQLSPGEYLFTLNAIDAEQNASNTAFTYVLKPETLMADRMAPAWKPTGYTSLGDSLAAGVTSNGTIGTGYAQLVAEALSQRGQLNFFSYNYATPGNTTAQILEDLNAGVTREVYGLPQQTSVVNAIKNSGIITLSAGGNDLLKYIPTAEAIQGLTPQMIGKIIERAAGNTALIVQKTKTLAPQDAKIYVMGLYNPYPAINDAKVKQAIQTLNLALKQAAEASGAIYVSTAEVMESNPAEFLPNPINVHPSEKGYAAIALKFLEKMPAPTSNVSAGEITQSSAKLTWTAAQDLSGVKEYRVKSVTSDTYQTVTGAVYLNLTGLSAGTSYSYQVQAVDNAGNITKSGPTVSFKTVSNLGGGSYGGGFAGVTQPFESTDAGLVLSTNAYTTVEKSVYGQSILEVKVDASKLSAVWDELKSMNVGDRKLILDLKMKHGVDVIIPAQELLQGAEKVGDTVLVIKTEQASYTVPLKMIPNDIAARLNAKQTDVQIHFGFRSVTAPTSLLQKHNLSLQGELYAFDVTAAAGTASQVLKAPAGSPGSATITVSGSVYGPKTSLVGFDPAAGTLRFAPSLISGANGKTTATLVRPVAPVYGIIAAGSHRFTDLTGHWSEVDVENLAGKLVIEGVSESSFDPDSPMTRAQFAALLVRALGVENASTNSSTFSDVTADGWYAAAVAAAVKAGLIQGFEDGTFRPDAPINRAEMTAMISRALTLAGKKANPSMSTLDRFADSGQIGEWARDAVAQAVAAGIIQGTTDTTFSPEDQATRAQAAAMLKRTLQFVGFMN